MPQTGFTRRNLSARTASGLSPSIVRLLVVLTALVALMLSKPSEAAVRAYGPEYEARVERYEYRNAWYVRHVFWRAAYLDGVRECEEFVRHKDVYQGPILAYGPVEVATRSLEYVDPPHLTMTTRHRRAVLRYGQFEAWQELPDLAQREDACREIIGEPSVKNTRWAELGGGRAQLVTYAYPIYHSNSQYGTFLVGSRESTEVLAPATPSSGGSAAAPAHRPATPDHRAELPPRAPTEVEGFSDYQQVAESLYHQDIREAFSLGLVVGKYDELSAYYDPETGITAGEMVNILARNLGADPLTEGLTAAAYLAQKGIQPPGGLNETLSLSTLESLARQIVSRGLAGKADLLVVRQAATGILTADASGGVTRAHAVAMFRPGYGGPLAPDGGGFEPPAGPGPAPVAPGSAPPPDGTLPASGPSEEPGQQLPQPGTEPRRPSRRRSDPWLGNVSEPSTPLDLVFVLSG